MYHQIGSKNRAGKLENLRSTKDIVRKELEKA